MIGWEYIRPYLTLPSSSSPPPPPVLHVTGGSRLSKLSKNYFSSKRDATKRLRQGWGERHKNLRVMAKSTRALPTRYSSWLLYMV